MNPQHTVPTLDDNGKIIWDSHAICTYLIEKYAKDDSLYPAKDTYIRAKINQHLHFDTGVLFIKARSSSEAIFLKGAAEFPADAIEQIHEAYSLMEAFLKEDPYLVGQQLTLADLCCLATVSTAQISAPISAVRFPRLHTWFQRLTELPFYEEVNGRRVEALRDVMISTMASNKKKIEIQYA